MKRDSSWEELGPKSLQKSVSMEFPRLDRTPRAFHNERAMADNTPAAPSYFEKFKAGLTDPRTLVTIAIAALVGVAGAFGVAKLYLAPIRAVSDTRFLSHECLMRLYDLQIAYHGAHGVYANDLETLLTGVTDAAQLRDKLKRSVDLNTLAVVGDARAFGEKKNPLNRYSPAFKSRTTMISGPSVPWIRSRRS